MIFVGAGVSSAFGIPTMPGLSQMVYQNFSPGSSERTQMDIVYSALAKYGFSNDIETVLTVLEALEKGGDIYRDIGPKMATLEVTGTIQVVMNISALIANLRNTIKDICSNPSFDKALSFYTNLYKILGATAFNDDYQDSERFRSIIVTTNYDITIEYALRKNKIACIDGFNRDDKRDELTFTGQWKDANYNESVQFVKLHGSIDYYRELDGTVIRDRATKKLIPIDERKELLIYPAGEKSISLTPYYDQYTKFRKSLFQRNHAAVLGFSFRDVAIYNIFMDWLTINPRARLVLLSDDSNRTRERFHEPIRKKIMTALVDFTKDDALDSLSTLARQGS